MVTETFKSGITNLRGFFYFSNFYIIKVDFGASDFEAAVLLQIEVKQKMLCRSLTFGPKSVEKHFQRGTLKNLTTPKLQGDLKV